VGPRVSSSKQASVRRFALFNYGNFWYKVLRKDKNKMEKKEDTYRRALVQVIRF